MIKNSNTAILLFTHTAEVEINRKTFGNSIGLKGNKLIAEVLISRITRTLSKADLPVFTVTTDNQIGSTFGERFTNAFSQIFEKGYNNVIFVGVTSPKLGQFVNIQFQI